MVLSGQKKSDKQEPVVRVDLCFLRRIFRDGDELKAEFSDGRTEVVGPIRDGEDVDYDRVKQLVDAAFALMPKPRDGIDGIDGVDGKSVDRAEVERMVREVVAEIPPAKNGIDADMAAILSATEQMVKAEVGRLPMPDTSGVVDFDVVSGNLVKTYRDGRKEPIKLPKSQAGGGISAQKARAIAEAVVSDSPTDLSNYYTKSESDANYDASGAASTAITDHEAAGDPHPQYLTASEGDAAYEPVGTAASEVSDHVADSDPHTQYQKESERGQANGYASLDSAGKVPVAQLPSSIMEYQGTWNASTNTPTLADGSGNADEAIGNVYRVSVAGTRNLGSGSISFEVGDYAILNASKVWEKSDTTDAVATVFGRSGNVSAAASDYDASQVDNDSGVSGTTVADALNTLNSGKQASNSNLTTISGLSPSNDDVLQRKSGAWANRSIAQLLSDLAAPGTTFQPLDSDLTAIAALTTQSLGRSLLTGSTFTALQQILGIRFGIVSGSDVTTTSASNADITGLSFPVAANEKWLILGHYGTACDNTGGIKFAVNGPSGAGLNYQAFGNQNTNIVQSGIGAIDTQTNLALNAVNGNRASFHSAILEIAGTGGTAQMRFASNTAGQTSTVKIGSVIIAIRIA